MDKVGSNGGSVSKAELEKISVTIERNLVDY